jgi:hypothetical protein
MARYWLFFVWLWVGSSLLHGQTYQHEGKLLWEIQTKKGKSYVWGCLHSNDKRLFDFPDSVYIAFLNTKQLALEVNVLELFVGRDPLINNNLLQLDKRGKMYTGTNEPSKTYYGTEDGMPQFMDAWFQSIAEMRNIPVIALESLEEQTKAIEEIPMIESMNPSKYKNDDMLMNLYLNGRIDLIDKLMRSNFMKQPQAYSKIIENRNRKLVESLKPLLSKETVFCAIGASHLYGNQGVLQLLRNNGYSIRPVTLSKGPKVSKAESTIKNIRQYIFQDTVDGSIVKAVFPGKPRLLPSKASYQELGQGNDYSIQWFTRDSSLSLIEYAEMYIASPPDCPYVLGTLEDGTQYAQGLHDAYQERLKWKRVLINENHVLIGTCHGGNKFMNSDRPVRFFNGIVIE